MSRQVCKTVYKFSELSDRAKARARDWYREGFGQDTDWADHTIEDAVRMGEMMGIHFHTRTIKLMGGGSRQEPLVYWQLHVQGSGASFSGSYSYKAGSVKAIETEAPTDTGLHAIVRELREVQKRYGYALEARIELRGNSGVHSLCTTIDVDKVRGPNECVSADLEAPLRAFMDWIYRQLDQEWDYQTSDTTIDECILGNGYEFDEDGRRA